MKWSPPSDEYIGRPPEGVRAGLEGPRRGPFVALARRSARAPTNFGDFK